MMGATQFDRQAFTTAPKAPPSSRDLLLRLGPAIFAGILVIAGLILYKLVSGYNAGDPGSIPAEQLADIQQKLATAERRLEQLERRRTTATAAALPAKAEDSNDKVKASAARAPRIV